MAMLSSDQNEIALETILCYCTGRGENMTNKNNFYALLLKMKKRYPESRIRYKEDHWFWKRLPKPLRESAITLNNTIWLPHRNNDFDSLAHEYDHYVLIKTIGIINFLFLYLFPQVLSIFFAMFAFLAIMFGLKAFAIIFGVVACLFLLPWPSKTRANIEVRAYLMKPFIAKYQGKDIFKYDSFIIDALKSWLYYKMVWTKKQSSDLMLDAKEVLNGEEAINNTSIAFKDVHEILTKDK
jgi:hypothetical protein